MSLSFSHVVLGVCVAWLLLAIRVQHNTHTSQDFLFARQRLPGFVAELGAVLAQTPLWLLMAIAVSAYSLGAAAAWIGFAAWLGVVVASWWLAPRLRARAQTHDAPTIARLLTVHTGEQLQMLSRRSIVAIVTLCLLLIVSVQLRWLADALAPRLDLSLLQTLLFAGGAILICGLLGSLWLAAYTDALLTALIAVLGFVIVCAALYAAHTANGDVLSALIKLFTEPAQRAAWEQTDHDDVLALAFGVGVAFLIGGSLAQPAALARYLSRAELPPKQRWIATAWSAAVVVLALLAGWCARIAASGAASPLAQIESWLALGWATPILALLLCIGMTALLSPCITVAGLWAHDLPRKERGASLLWHRWALVAVVVAMVWLAYRLPARDFSPLWLAWHSLSASLAPLLIVQLSGKRVRPGSALGSIWAGFALTLIFHAMPDTTGDLLERAIPFIAAMGIALSGGDQRRNPNRADRGDETVHDRLPI
jgi:sodium/proline symporter